MVGAIVRSANNDVVNSVSIEIAGGQSSSVREDMVASIIIDRDGLRHADGCPRCGSKNSQVRRSVVEV